MADYVVRMTGQDNLSGTIKQVKSELNDLGKTTSKIDQIDAKFSKITNSTAPLKKQLRDLKTLMAQMNMDGLANTEQYTKIAQEAGKIKDAMDDAAAATKRFSSDTANLDAGVQALQGIVAVGGVATGVMAMFGVENEKVQQAILKVQGALTVLNGVQQVANVLNKDSALIQTLKAARMRVATAAQVSQTAATKAGTIAQLKLNAAVLANPYVLAAAAVVALGVAIYNLVKKSDELSEAEERAKKIAEEVQGVYEDGAKTYMKARLELSQLRDSLDNFNGSKEEEKRLVEDLNNKYGNALGKYKDLDSWKRVLGDSTYYYCRLLEHEARVTALNAKAAEAYAKAIAGEDVETNWALFNTLSAEAERQSKYVEFFRNQLNRTRRSNGDMSYSSSGSGKSSGSGRSTRSPKTGGGGSSTNNDKKGLINNYEKEIQELKEKRDSAETEKALAEAIKNLNDKEKEYTEFKIRVGLEDNPVENLEKEVQEALDKSDVKVEIPVSSFDLAMSKAKGERTDSLDQIKAQMYANDDQIASLKAYQQQMIEAKDTGTELYQKLTDKIKELEEAQKGYGDTIAGVISLQKKKDEQDRQEAQRLEAKKQLYEDLMSTAQSLGSGLQSLGQEEAAAAIQIATTTAQAVQQIIPQVMALIGVKQGEALASGTASAAAMPFPANIAAIAAIVAQLMAVFATIASVAGKFAGGGVVGGGSYYGDMVMARVNAGEMILNRRQQANLFRAIESGDIGAGQTVLVPEFKIKGSDLYGTLRNFSKSVGKTGKVTGIR